MNDLWFRCQRKWEKFWSVWQSTKNIRRGFPPNLSKWYFPIPNNFLRNFSCLWSRSRDILNEGGVCWMLVCNYCNLLPWKVDRASTTDVTAEKLWTSRHNMTWQYEINKKQKREIHNPCIAISEGNVEIGHSEEDFFLSIFCKVHFSMTPEQIYWEFSLFGPSCCLCCCRAQFSSSELAKLWRCAIFVYWPSTIMDQPLPPYTDPLPPSTNK